MKFFSKSVRFGKIFFCNETFVGVTAPAILWNIFFYYKIFNKNTNFLFDRVTFPQHLIPLSLVIIRNFVYCRVFSHAIIANNTIGLLRKFGKNESFCLNSHLDPYEIDTGRIRNTERTSEYGTGNDLYRGPTE